MFKVNSNESKSCLETESKKTPCNIPANQFHLMREEKEFYIDKTLFIRKIVDSSTRVICFRLPSGFGKSVQLSMLRCFFASEVDGVKTDTLFQGLKISSDINLMKEHQGQHIVLYFDFSLLKANNNIEFLKGFLVELSKSIHEQIRALPYKLNSSGIYKKLQKLLNKISEINIKINANPNYSLRNYEIRSCFRNFVELMSRSAKKDQHDSPQLSVLIDGIDVPIVLGLQRGFANDAKDFILDLLLYFKDNTYVKFQYLILTQTYPFSLGRLTCHIYHLDDGTSPKYFGITEEEVNKFFAFNSNEEKDEFRLSLAHRHSWWQKINNAYQEESYIFSPADIKRRLGGQSDYMEPDKLLKEYMIRRGEIKLSSSFIAPTLLHVKSHFIPRTLRLDNLDPMTDLYTLLVCTGHIAHELLSTTLSYAINFRFHFHNRTTVACYKKYDMLSLSFKLGVLAIFFNMKNVCQGRIPNDDVEIIGSFLQQSDCYAMMRVSKTTLFHAKKLIGLEDQKSPPRVDAQIQTKSVSPSFTNSGC